MTEKLYWKDQYMKEFNAKVIKAEDGGLILDQTVFYPTGGGQQNDIGKLIANSVEYRVADVKRSGDDILHVLEPMVQITEGTEVKGQIDWDRRYILMRYHTAVHILGAVMAKQYNGNATGGQIYTDKAHLDFDCPTLTRELAVKIAEESNRIAHEEHNVSAKFVTQTAALATPELVRTEPGRELLKGLDKVRVVDIEGFDIQTDGGTHVLNTREIGDIKFNKFDNKGSHRKRIEIVIS